MLGRRAAAAADDVDDSGARPLAELATVANAFLCCYPNAGLPNPLSETGYDETPDYTSGLLKEFAKSGFLNIAGGCCGTTPEHIALIAERVGKYGPRVPGFRELANAA